MQPAQTLKTFIHLSNGIFFIFYNDVTPAEKNGHKMQSGALVIAQNYILNSNK